ncbi:hypothetical protein RO3G_09439 [Rhizopus delemar RA 99-880]|uniref:Uncharacterized protein n=1 Tax=Rhizopus delemar (strain RA 99-880 / ATCC MYA-4621 / FGSC 9543 / NRRL 43880) TaxID=246409 RepID=I1C8E9_RHIO9|nr:hypothetical protein RO3G_09439 [Rhizopus delemar RA 99-880]|eukprot:EIE84729.1 hypothetical protein RO3G_09439 [Rhizopus delemar RA 99-880]
MINDIPTAIARQKRIKETERYDTQIPESDFEKDDALEPVAFWSPKVDRSYKSTLPN